MNTSLKIATLAMGLAVALGGASAASANTPWKAHHPRRAELNARLERQSHRVGVERRKGEMTLAQAQSVRAQDHGIRAQERLDASRHNGHITKAEQRQLNHAATGVSRQIRG